MRQIDRLLLLLTIPSRLATLTHSHHGRRNGPSSDAVLRECPDYTMENPFMMKNIARGIVIAAACLALSVSIRAGVPRGGPSAGSGLTEMIERFRADQGTLRQFYTIDVSAARYARMKRFYSETLSAITRVKFDSLGQDGRVDYLLLRNYCEHMLRHLDLQWKAADEASPLVPFAETIIRLREDLQRMQFADPARSADTLNGLTRLIAETRRRLEASMGTEGKGPPAKVRMTAARRAAGTVDELREALKEWFEFYDGYDPLFTWWAGEPYRAAAAELKTYGTFVREKLAGMKSEDNDAIVGDPIGREALLEELAYAMIPYTPEELIAIGNREFSWCEKEMKRASGELGYGDDWKKALERVKTHYVEPGKQPALIRDLAQEAVKFLDDHDLVTVPDLVRETLRMEMMSPEQQRYNPFFTGGDAIRVSYPTNGMGHEQKMMSMRGNNIHFARATVFHELIPGHTLQMFMNERYRPYREVFSTPFWLEGGALYWEMLFWDMGFARTPEDRIGMLFWRMHRAARIIFSLSFHLQKMTGQECVDFLVERVGHERDNASAEVRRSVAGGYGPLYQCSYMLGGLQLRALRRELVDSGKMTNREFHDAILRENSIPIEMVRASLTGQRLSPEYHTSWRFYE